MKTAFMKSVWCVLACAALYGAVAVVIITTQPTPAPHLDPPVIVVRNECGSELSIETVQALFDTTGYVIRMEGLTRCEKAFYIYRKGEK